MAYDKSGLVTTCSHMIASSASWYGTLAISSTSSGVDGQSSIDNESPTGSGIEDGAQPFMLKCTSTHW